MKTAVRTIVPVLVAGLLGVACGAGEGGTNSPSSDAPASVFEYPESMTVELIRDPTKLDDLTMRDLDGHQIALSDMRGKITLVNFWATWCGPCRAEIPDLVELQDRYPDQLQIIGVSLDESGPETVRAFADTFEMNYPVVMTTPEITKQFPGVFALPTTFILDGEGRVSQLHVGIVKPAVLEQEARYLAGLPTDVEVRFTEGTQQTRLVDAAHATEIPGLDLSVLTAKQRELALQRLNEDGCTCGCALTLAQCRINDASCTFSLPLAQDVVDQILAES